jgi:hypothetical protein
MTEHYSTSDYEVNPLYGGLISDYANFVSKEQTKVETFENYDKTRAEHIAQEYDEFFWQHGSGIAVFMPEYYSMYPGIKAEGEDLELRSAMIDEMSDLLWYGFDVANNHEFKACDLVVRALEDRTGRDVQAPVTFNDIQFSVMSSASHIVVNELLGVTSLVKDPSRVLTRFEQRLIRSLRNDENGTSVPGVSGEEHIADLDVALGEFLVALTYVAVDIFGVDLETLANYSVYKLRHRAIKGKMPGKVLFDLFC